MVIDAGQQLAVAPVGAVDAADEVELPQCHRGFPLPSFVLARLPLFLRTNQTIPHQDPVHGRPGRNGLQASTCQLEHDPARTPTTMLTAHLADLRIYPDRHSRRRRVWSTGPSGVDECEGVEHLRVDRIGALEGVEKVLTTGRSQADDESCSADGNGEIDLPASGSGPGPGHPC